MQKKKTIGLVAHDAQKKYMLEWVEKHAVKLSQHNFVCTGTTGSLIKKMMDEKFSKLKTTITILHSGPLGGDQQMGALIAENKIDILIFFTDPMTTQPHDVDIKALIRLCAVYNIALAVTYATADYLIESPLFDTEYEPLQHDYGSYLRRSF